VCRDRCREQMQYQSLLVARDLRPAPVVGGGADCAATDRRATNVHAGTTARGAAKGYGTAPPCRRRRTETAREALVRRDFSSLKKAAPRELQDDATPLP
jgi:hypothetical protein